MSLMEQMAERLKKFVNPEELTRCMESMGDVTGVSDAEMLSIYYGWCLHQAVKVFSTPAKEQ